MAKNKSKRELEKAKAQLQADVQAAEAEIAPILEKYNLLLTVLYAYMSDGSAPIRGSVGYVRRPEKDDK